MHSVQWGDVPAWVTAAVALAALIAAARAYRKQSDAYDKQATQVDLQKTQLEEQRAVNTEQTRVLKLQGEELQASIAQRKRDAAQRHRAQAAQIYVTAIIARGFGYDSAHRSLEVTVRNTSQQPVYDLHRAWRVFTG